MTASIRTKHSEPGETATTSARLRSSVIVALRQVRPLLQRDGGDVELVGVDRDGVVKVRFLGACIDCPSNDTTLTEGIERRVRADVPGIRRVERVP